MADTSAGGATRSSASCCTFLIYGIAVELAEQGIAVFLGPVGQVGDEGFDLFAGGFAEGFGAAEIDGVGLDQVGIELVLADQLAEAVADFGAAVVSVLPLTGWGGSFFDSREEGTGSANEPISSTEQMPMP